MPSAADMIKMCDQDGDAHVSLDESHACIDAQVPEDYRQEAHDMVDEHFAEVADEDSLVNAAELEAAMDAHDTMDHEHNKGEGPNAEDIFAMCDEDGDGFLSLDEVNACIDT